MKGSPEIIKILNDVLRKELTGINQYFIHSKMCKNWGYEVLAGVAWKESIEEMKHADQIIERILFLEGIPNLSAYDKISVGSSVQQQLSSDLGLEEAALVVLRGGIKTCLDANDNASRELLEHILVDEEEHVDWIETQLHQIKELGAENYLAQQIFKKT
ncbi:MAG TPA: bacterioferritin [Candidatus Binatia bacterium]|jgi:bacterioferritin